MVQPELRHLLSPNVADLKVYRPDDEAFAIFLQAIVGPRGREAGESFCFTVCSPQWIEQNCVEPMLGVHFLIVPSFNYDQTVGFVSKIVNASAAETWAECAIKLQRLGAWEFDGYEA